MQVEHHDLHHEFPEFSDAIHALKIEHHHFARLFDEYHDVNRAIHRAETNVEPVGDAHMEAMRKQRMVLKDKIYGMLTKA